MNKNSDPTKTIPEYPTGIDLLDTEFLVSMIFYSAWGLQEWFKIITVFETTNKPVLINLDPKCPDSLSVLTSSLISKGDDNENYWSMNNSNYEQKLNHIKLFVGGIIGFNNYLKLIKKDFVTPLFNIYSTWPKSGVNINFYYDQEPINISALNTHYGVVSLAENIVKLWNTYMSNKMDGKDFPYTKINPPNIDFIKIMKLLKDESSRAMSRVIKLLSKQNLLPKHVDTSKLVMDPPELEKIFDELYQIKPAKSAPDVEPNGVARAIDPQVDFSVIAPSSGVAQITSGAEVTQGDSSKSTPTGESMQKPRKPPSPQADSKPIEGSAVQTVPLEPKDHNEEIYSTKPNAPTKLEISQIDQESDLTTPKKILDILLKFSKTELYVLLKSKKIKSIIKPGTKNRILVSKKSALKWLEDNK